MYNLPKYNTAPVLTDYNPINVNCLTLRFMGMAAVALIVIYLYHIFSLASITFL